MTDPYSDLGGLPSVPLPEPPNLGQQFLDALTPQARNSLHRTQAAHAALTKALGRGWTVEAVARECSRDLGTAANVGGIIQHRLQWCADRDPSGTTLPKFHQPKPWCGQCSDPHTRWRNDVDIAVRCDCWTQPKAD